MKMMTKAMLAMSVVAASASPAAAVTYTLTGALTAGDPTFNRTLDGNPPTSLSGVGTAVHYDTLSFAVSAAGSYTFLLNSGTGGFDTFLSLYAGTFNPASALTNILQANDDLNGLTTSGFARTLAAGTSYTAVFTAFANTGLGAYTFTLDGPGTVTPAGTPSVPEPASWAMMILGTGAIGGALRRRSKISTTVKFA
jgi:hypothetical protein